MKTGGFNDKAEKPSYDVVIIGGAMMGSSVAWHLSDNADFNGSVLVVERDPSYLHSSTAHTNSCIRQQFSTTLNVQISQFAAQTINNFRARLGGDARIPDLKIQNFGYLYLADNEYFADTLRRNQKIQIAAGTATRLLDPAELAAAYPYFKLDDIVLGSINRRNEGYWEGGTVFDWWRRQAMARGVEYVAGEVVAVTCGGSRDRVESVTLDSGAVITCGHVVNASGPRAAKTAALAGIDIPVEPRKRFSWVFKAAKPIPGVMPLTIAPSGVHFRGDGPDTYLVGGQPPDDVAVDFDDFSMDDALWQDRVWPALAARVPQFEAIKLINQWAGHYAYNVFDQNAIVGPHPELGNFLFVNGFSGHGLQQSPAMGRGIAEWISYGRYQSLDLHPFGFERILRDMRFTEGAII